VTPSTTTTRETLVWAFAAVYAGTQIAQPLSGNAIPSSAFDVAIRLSAFTTAACAWVHPLWMAGHHAAASDQTVQDARGILWKVADVRESAVLVGLFTIVFASMAAIFSVTRRSSK
jgi:hypothetical protein